MKRLALRLAILASSFTLHCAEPGALEEEEQAAVRLPFAIPPVPWNEFFLADGGDPPAPPPAPDCNDEAGLPLAVEALIARLDTRRYEVRAQASACLTYRLDATLRDRLHRYLSRENPALEPRRRVERILATANGVRSHYEVHGRYVGVESVNHKHSEGIELDATMCEAAGSTAQSVHDHLLSSHFASYLSRFHDGYRSLFGVEPGPVRSELSIQRTEVGAFCNLARDREIVPGVENVRCDFTCPCTAAAPALPQRKVRLTLYQVVFERIRDVARLHVRMWGRNALATSQFARTCSEVCRRNGQVLNYAAVALRSPNTPHVIDAADRGEVRCKDNAGLPAWPGNRDWRAARVKYRTARTVSRWPLFLNVNGCPAGVPCDGAATSLYLSVLYYDSQGREIEHTLPVNRSRVTQHTLLHAEPGAHVTIRLRTNPQHAAVEEEDEPKLVLHAGGTTPRGLVFERDEEGTRLRLERLPNAATTIELKLAPAPPPLE